MIQHFGDLEFRHTEGEAQELWSRAIERCWSDPS
jgi:hypothetical protein